MHRKRLTMYTTLTIVFVGMTGTEHFNWGNRFIRAALVMELSFDPARNRNRVEEGRLSRNRGRRKR